MRRGGSDDIAPEEHAPESGFTLVEVLVAMMVFAIIALAFLHTVGASLRAYQVARLKTTAENLANEEIENARRLAYEDLGTVAGNPPGVVEPVRTVTVGSRDFEVQTRVAYVDDPLPGGFQTAANYKRLEVTIVDADADRVLTRLVTKVAPPTQPGITNAVAKVRVVDYALNQPLPGAQVRLSGGPSSRVDVADAAGDVVFAALTPNPLTGPQSHYEIAASHPTYVVLPEDQPPAPSARVQLDPGQLFTTSIRMFKPPTITVDVVDENGLPYTGAVTVEVSSSRGRATVPVTGGTATITSLGGLPVVPGLEYTLGASASGRYATAVTQVVPDDYPRVLTSSFTLTLQPASVARLVVDLRDASNNNPIPSYDVEIVGGPLDVQLGGRTNAGGVLQIDVPRGAGYTVRVKPAGAYAAAEGTVDVPGPGATPFRLNVPRAS